MIDIPKLELEEQNLWFKKLLSHGTYEITFTKVDGESRTMPCTLDPVLLPVVELKEGRAQRQPKLETLSVWCTDKQEWRSFRIANVTAIKEL